MMELIFKHIQEQPEFYAWVFGIVNVLWGAFLYFNKVRYSEEIERLKQSLNLDLERRRKVFEMKSGQYEAYFNNIDTCQRKHQNDYHKIFVPIFNEFNKKYLTAEANDDKEGATAATLWFSEEIQKITLYGFQELQALEHQANSLKLQQATKLLSCLKGCVSHMKKYLKHLQNSLVG